MRKQTLAIIFIVLGLICSQFRRIHHYQSSSNSEHALEKKRIGTSTKSDTAFQRFTCDGRKYCSEMTSCEEAMFFLKNCPGVKMDGDNNGIPCERQWCK
jgi:hypothetical protein